MWKTFALLSAFFAALTAILAKCGVKGVDANLATAVRTAVILILTWAIVLFSGKGISALGTLSVRNWSFLIASGIATGLSWLFYFKALQEGNVSLVAPIDKLSVAITILLGIVFLHEPADPKVLIGGGLIVAGSLVLLR